MKKILIFFILFITVGCCATKKVQYIPIQEKTIIEYRDSIVRIIDTIKIEVPRETIKEVMPIIDTSRLETKIAISEAFVDTVSMKLHHTLKNKPNSLKMAIDTVVIVKTKTEYLEKPVIQEIEVPVQFVPKIFWAALVFSIVVIIVIVLKIYLRFNGI